MFDYCMMKYLAFAFFFSLVTNVYSQDYSIKRNKFFDYLLSSHEDINNVVFQKPISLLQQFSKKNERFHRYITKIDGNLFLTTEGYGEVYKYKQTKDSLLYFTRVDSTIFSGNNFNSSQFVYDKKIFSFGGYGYWKYNGQLRQFNEGHD